MPEQTAPWVQPVRQRLRAWRGGQLLFDADTWVEEDRQTYGDVAWAHLEPDPARTTCQYKGEASYFRVRDSDVRLWTYRHPDPEAAAIAGHLAAAAEQSGVHITVDGTPEAQL